VSGGIWHEAALACPSCGEAVACYWPEDEYAAPQRCEACGRVFDATWPGFRFEPETVVVEASPP